MERNQNAGSGQNVIIISIAGLSGKAACLEEVVLPSDVTIVKFLFRSDALTEEAITQSIIDAAVADLVRLTKRSIEDSSSPVRFPERFCNVSSLATHTRNSVPLSCSSPVTLAEQCSRRYFYSSKAKYF